MAKSPAETLRGNVAKVRSNIEAACRRAGRAPDSVCLVAVTKYVDLGVIRALLAAGVCDLGESRVQQLAARAGELRFPATDWMTPLDAPRWHLIGHLQRNKVKAALPHARIIHSLDSERLAAEIDAVADRLSATIDAFIEVGTAGETNKTGATPDDATRLAEATNRLPHIRLRGLMTMAPLDPEPEHARPHFAALRALLERLRAGGAVGPECVHLSMGMSQDYAVAVEEGATFVRVGSALFEGMLPDAPAAGAGPDA